MKARRLVEKNATFQMRNDGGLNQGRGNKNKKQKPMDANNV